MGNVESNEKSPQSPENENPRSRDMEKGLSVSQAPQNGPGQPITPRPVLNSATYLFRKEILLLTKNVQIHTG
jgi:hypothetical protein